MQEDFIRRFRAPATLEHMAGGEERGEWEYKWEEEQAARERYEGATVGLAVDPARHQDANGESGGGGNLNTPRTGPYAREKVPVLCAGDEIR